jgi:hypothetical protein
MSSFGKTRPLQFGIGLERGILKKLPRPCMKLLKKIMRMRFGVIGSISGASYFRSHPVSMSMEKICQKC